MEGSAALRQPVTSPEVWRVVRDLANAAARARLAIHRAFIYCSVPNSVSLIATQYGHPEFLWWQVESRLQRRRYETRS